jgi:UDP-N-acetylglucosamine 4,6-dehydratase
VELARSVAPECEIEYVGIRPGEKLHEVLISEDEARNAIEQDGMYIILPAHPWWSQSNWSGGMALPEGFRFSSESNTEWLSADRFLQLVGAD